jgi:ubiquinone/menaquinone biosynthesis C-methylase UbiE
VKRIPVPELLDTDSGTSREVADSLRDLRMFNQRFGGVRVMAQLLLEVARQRGLQEVSWLDVAGSTGDMVTLTQGALRGSDITLHPVVLDRAPSHLHLPGNGSHLNICGDALALPFRDNSFDVVGSSLFVHHLEPEELQQFAGEGLRVARHAFVINDLVRHPLHLALSYAGAPLYRSRLTRHDAPASVRRAYTVAEIRDILGHAGAEEFSIETFYLFRMGVTLWKERPNPSLT